MHEDYNFETDLEAMETLGQLGEALTAARTHEKNVMHNLAAAIRAADKVASRAQILVSVPLAKRTVYRILGSDDPET